ncbi:COP9 signalosome complex subunit 6 [Drosophila sechellia]|uniref:COP9 signalosome complex subunit 6 n=3 Tax=melanogaster subgroup TaxID=32351 RepID=B4R0M5_DROSI|nr:COP9 signalosome complex subunit 6 [Drosophila sechellia]XP_002104445.1 COP9 signalosome complex subunit 6 [Drosophila simulans]XP_033163530.1 COP9 signalosome complex subunit 6 [Drosophila mauritiana]EDW43210.1 GM26445 [Drosophila sechellia]EDX13948.1 GD20964 [Drosophila simulans]KMZ05139.1 COP9 complex homolog subunit 6 [Drosophila simulans]
MEQMEVDVDMSAKPSTSSSAAAGSSMTVDKTADQNPQPQGNIMAAAGTSGSVTISLHPLVIMNISEHWTRFRAQHGEPRQVYGALIGKQKGRNIEIMNSFELKTDVIGDETVINKDYYNKKEQQYKQVFSDLDFIGWYTTGDNPTADDIKIQRQIAAINECPIMLQLNPLSRSVDHLPLKLFESLIDLVDGEATMLFVPLTYTLATEEAERIGVDHVARMTSNESGEKSVVAEHLVAQDSAIKMLNTRIKIVLQYIRDVEAGKLRANQEILREAYALCHRLPVMQVPAFQEEFYTQCNDVGLISYLGTLTKGCNDMHHFVNKFNMLYDRQGSSRRMRGLYY